MTTQFVEQVEECIKVAKRNGLSSCIVPAFFGDYEEYLNNLQYVNELIKEGYCVFYKKNLKNDSIEVKEIQIVQKNNIIDYPFAVDGLFPMITMVGDHLYNVVFDDKDGYYGKIESNENLTGKVAEIRYNQIMMGSSKGMKELIVAWRSEEIQFWRDCALFEEYDGKIFEGHKIMNRPEVVRELKEFFGVDNLNQVEGEYSEELEVIQKINQNLPILVELLKDEIVIRACSNVWDFTR